MPTAVGELYSLSLRDCFLLHCAIHPPEPRPLCQRSLPLCRLLSGSFRGWSQAADKLCQQTLADGYEQLASQVGGMKAENERLRRDNERFVRLIDSGEWGRGRVAELTQASELAQTGCPCY